MKTTGYKKILPVSASAFFITLIVVFLAYRLCGIVPFGSKGTLAINDAYYQYLDFFAFLKDVLSGKQTVGYSFSNGLGQNTVGFFSYYLSSPFNLLVLFFSKENLNAFFNLAAALKMAAASAAFAVFAMLRFRWQRREYSAVLVSVCYGLMQYNITQSSNIMWLDGVYMLPLILLGVTHNVKGESGTLLSISVCLSILFNWYTAGINCLFAVCWFVYEYLTQYKMLPRKLKPIGCFALSAMVGIMLSASFFLPAAYALSLGKGGKLDWGELLNFDRLGSPLSVISCYTPGAVSSRGEVSLFCGSFVIIGTAGFFVSEETGIGKKCIAFLLLVFSVSIYYFRCLFIVFSLLKNATSYWYRYSYVSCFLLCAFAGNYFSSWNGGRKRMILTADLAAAAIHILAVCRYKPELMKYAAVTETVLVFTAVLMLLPHRIQKPGITALLISVLVLGEMGFSTVLLIRSHHAEYADLFSQYESEQIVQTDEIKAWNPGDYRIAQLMTRSMNYQSSTAFRNEALAFGYRAVEQYTSAAEKTQLDWLEKVGYPCWMDSMVVKDWFILPVDSFLSVKYVLSPYSVDGLIRLENLPEKNGKLVYENPFALPFAMVCRNGEFTITESGNSFDYINRFYSLLTDGQTAVFHLLEFRETATDDGLKYELLLPERNSICYGLIKGLRADDRIVVGDQLFYTRLRSSGCLFNVPSETGCDGIAEVMLACTKPEEKKAEFCYIDLDEFKKITDMLKQSAPQNIEIYNGGFSCCTDTENESFLVTTICAEKGWRAYDNGVKTDWITVDNTFIAVPLSRGEHFIELKFRVPYLEEGIVISFAAAVYLIADCCMRKRRNKTPPG